MSLEDLNNMYPYDPNTGSKGFTDKNTNHSYLELYQKLLLPIKNKATHVLEVGVMEGGSIDLWSKFFTNAHVFGIDIVDNVRIDELRKNNKVTLLLNNNAYDPEFVKQRFLNNNITFDFLLDDGPHTLESMLKFIQYYLPLLKDNGIFIIEDVPHINWIDILVKQVPINLQKYIKVYDRRHIKNRGDDIVFTVDKLDS
jgi:cephalosporin hydroxylase